MLKKKISFLVAIFCSFFIFTPGSAQVKKYPKSLLWKISGNGLREPSYLYGTIHLTDKRVFNFGDSLYRAIESTKGLAIEIHPDSAINEYLYQKLDKDTTALLKSILSKKEFSRLATAISLRTMKPAGESTVRDLVQAPDDYTKQMYQDSSMNTFMDGWLYATAKKQGKWTGGIEDVADQGIYLSPEVKNAADVERILKSKIIENEDVDEFIRIYQLEDINRITEVTGRQLDEDTVLVRRNKKMAVRMDSLAAIRSTFFAVGAAHLPGTQGVIELLQRKGYELTPVVSSSRLHATNYQFAEVQSDWVTVTSIDSLYTVEMPGMPDDKSQNLASMNMRMYADATTGLAYLCGVRPSPIDPEKSDSLMTDIIKMVMAKGEFDKPRPIQYLGMNGKEVTGKSDKDAYIRLQVFYRNNYIYFLILSGTQIEIVQNANAERFFRSIKLLQSKPPVSWALFKPDDGYVEVKMPETVRKLTLPKQADLGKTQTLQVFSAIDNKTGNTYLLRFGKTLYEYYLPNDSAYFRELQGNFMTNAPDAVVMDSAVIEFEGYPAYSVVLKAEDKYAMRFLFVNRGNRSYMLGMVSEWDKRYSNDAQSFFSSLKFMQLPTPPLKKAQGWNGAFSAEVPGELILKSRDTDTSMQNDDSTPYVFSYDSISAINYTVMRDSMNKFIWQKNDSTHIKLLKDLQRNNKDSVGEVKVVKNGSLPGIEMDIYSKATKQLKRIRILFDEYAYYKIFAFMPPQLSSSPYYNRFFESFRVTKETFPISLYQNKGCALLKALASTDSTEQKLAKSALLDAPFDSSNFSCLYEAMLKEYPVDSISGKNINEEIFDAISLISDSTVVKHIAKIYPDLPPAQVKFSNDLLNILANSQTEYAYQTLNKLLDTRLPTDQSSSFFYALNDSLQLTKSLFPAILKHTADSSMVLGLSFLAGHLLDSSLITIDQVKSYGSFWEASAKRILQEYRKGDGEYYLHFSRDLLNLLGKLHSSEANRLLQQFSALRNMYISSTAIEILLDNKQPIQSAPLLYLCSDDYYRQYVYDTLKGAKKLNLFPSKYLTQKYFAQSSLYEVASDDYDITMKYLGERQIQFKGKKQKFYLYKVVVMYDEETNEKAEYLGIAGAFSLNPAKVELVTNASSVYFEETYDPKQLERQLKLLIAQMKADYENE